MILEERSPFYAKADLLFDTSGKVPSDCLESVATAVQRTIATRVS